MKKFRRGAKVDVMFWIFCFVERENASEEICSFVETCGKRGCRFDVCSLCGLFRFASGHDEWKVFCRVVVRVVVQSFSQKIF